MDIKKLDEKVSVGGQIQPGDVAEIARRGFKTLICNRPDGEEPGQPVFDGIAAAANSAGIDVVFQPVTPSTMGPAVAREFADAVDASDGSVFAYCRTGTRCATLWTIASLIDGVPRDNLRKATGRAGYDMSALLGSAPS